MSERTDEVVRVCPKCGGPIRTENVRGELVRRCTRCGATVRESRLNSLRAGA